MPSVNELKINYTIFYCAPNILHHSYVYSTHLKVNKRYMNINIWCQQKKRTNIIEAKPIILIDGFWSFFDDISKSFES